MGAIPAGDDLEFHTLWCRFTRPSMFTFAQRSTGTLFVGPDDAEFILAGRTEPEWRCSEIVSAKRGYAGTDFVNRWVEVKAGACVPGGTVYLNDGRWLGWHGILTRTNNRIAAALSELIPRSG